eukprot:1268694-Alexandrium_andersonii.AAC.1
MCIRDRWTDSRWASMAGSCRAMAASLATGLESLVSYVRSQPGQSDYFSHGFERCSADVKRFFAVWGTFILGRGVHPTCALGGRSCGLHDRQHWSGVGT